MNAQLQRNPRAVAYRTRGVRHGPITRLMSPGDLGELLKPFVFLDLVDYAGGAGPQGFGMHPHSGIATLTYLAQGATTYEDSTGESGTLDAGGVEWMRAGGGVWHTGSIVDDGPAKGFQLWIALPASEEHAPAQSQYIPAAEVARDGPVRVLLGQHGDIRSAIRAPAPMNYLAVSLEDGEHWRYAPPAGHTVAWIAVSAGRVDAGTTIDAGELVAFEESNRAIDFIAQGETEFVLGSAERHPHDLVMGRYSVHTSPAALALGEHEIRRIRARLPRI
jgi:redox-sensitive bicupin YhaK (pirin superfamily)